MEDQSFSKTKEFWRTTLQRIQNILELIIQTVTSNQTQHAIKIFERFLENEEVTIRDLICDIMHIIKF